MLGLPRGIVQLTRYHAAWPKLFDEEALRLRNALGPLIGQIEHVGSTAVPGMISKPIIDLMAAVPSLSMAYTLIAPLELLGYEHCPDTPEPSRLFFALGPHSCRTHYLSLAERGSKAWNDQICFRDHLCAHPKSSAAYSELKQ
jgi:GrpB-like predicted nucleotidyltransferase (UPF0157 family)